MPYSPAVAGEPGWPAAPVSGDGTQGHAPMMQALMPGGHVAYPENRAAVLKALPESSALLWSGWDELSFDFLPLT